MIKINDINISNSHYLIFPDYKLVVENKTHNQITDIIYALGLQDKAEMEFSCFKGNLFWGDSMVIIPSNKCMLRCKYCYSHSGANNTNSFIDEDQIKKFIRMFLERQKIFKYLKHDYLFKFLFHGGGEPTYDWDLFKQIVLYILEESKVQHCRVSLKLVTNGMFSIQKAKWLREMFDEVIFSLDGPNYINDVVRPLIGSKSSTEIVTNNIKIVSETTNVGIHCVVTGLSKNKGREITEHFKKCFPNVKYIHYEKYRETLFGNNDIEPISGKDFTSFLNECVNLSGDKVKSVYCDFSPKKEFCKAYDGQRIFCFPNGNITACIEHDSDSHGTKYVIGNYKTGVYDSNAMAEIQTEIRSHMKNFQCEKCFAYMFCKGGCRSMYSQSRNYFSEWCEPFKDNVYQFLSNLVTRVESQELCLNGEIIHYYKL